jgi:hypothetical protein
VRLTIAQQIHRHGKGPLPTFHLFCAECRMTASATEVSQTASFDGKSQGAATQLRLEIAAKVIPHPEKVRLTAASSEFLTCLLILSSKYSLDLRVCFCHVIEGVVWWGGCLFRQQCWGRCTGGCRWCWWMARERHKSSRYLFLIITLIFVARPEYRDSSSPLLQCAQHDQRPSAVRMA